MGASEWNARAGATSPDAVRPAVAPLIVPAHFTLSRLRRRAGRGPREARALGDGWEAAGTVGARPLPPPQPSLAGGRGGALCGWEGARQSPPQLRERGALRGREGRVSAQEALAETTMPDAVRPAVDPLTVPAHFTLSRLRGRAGRGPRVAREAQGVRGWLGSRGHCRRASFAPSPTLARKRERGRVVRAGRDASVSPAAKKGARCLGEKGACQSEAQRQNY
ncbi:hypothetical protein GCM10007301_02500 [Azorhizobium oxalatiphilum]|uniref:Uncharacterized protein n=1 Tax=Azorhizobium oxalatiphilum TaxID=980631 RepID=A0A917BM88_9HYPH|nr:hypothetical protein GCM10007301_02500 [Azorhizobium oxalatiphilum]